jgi:hypothetical protein
VRLLSKFGGEARVLLIASKSQQVSVLPISFFGDGRRGFRRICGSMDSL